LTVPPEQANLASIGDDAEHSSLGLLYAWRHSQAAAAASGAFALAMAILAPLLAAVFDDKARLECWNVALFIAGAALAAIGGVLFRRHAAQVQRRYLKAVQVWDPEELLRW
jgi:hypothetical protein